MSTNLSSYGGYRKLDVFTFASLLYLETLHFCERFLTLQNDPKGRLYDQMTQAARSGRANIIEGSERRGTSRETVMKLTDVARASILELMGDYEMWIVSHGSLPWKRDAPEAEGIRAWRLDPHGEWTDPLYDSNVYLMEQQKHFQQWTQGDSISTANALLLLCRRTARLLTRLIESQHQAFLEKGDFREQLRKQRIEARSSTPAQESTPTCPICGKPMRKRIAQRGPNAGNPFWSCTGYPECKGTRRVESNQDSQH